MRHALSVATLAVSIALLAVVVWGVSTVDRAAFHHIPLPTPPTAAMIYTTPEGDRWITQALPGEDPVAAARRFRRMVETQPGTMSRESLCKFDQWTDAEGNTTTVTACRGPNETQEAFCARFDALVAAMQEVFPCD